MEEKLRRLMKHEGINSTRLAEILGIQASGISHIMSGRNKPSYDFLLKLLQRFPQISPDWLMLNRGPMYRDEIKRSAGGADRGTWRGMDEDGERSENERLGGEWFGNEAGFANDAARVSAFVSRSYAPDKSNDAPDNASNFVSGNASTHAQGSASSATNHTSPHASISTSSAPEGIASGRNSGSAPQQPISRQSPGGAMSGSNGDQSGGEWFGNERSSGERSKNERSENEQSGNERVIGDRSGGGAIGDPSDGSPGNQARLAAQMATSTPVDAIKSLPGSRKSIERVVVFYHDKTFSEYRPE